MHVLVLAAQTSAQVVRFSWPAVLKALISHEVVQSPLPSSTSSNTVSSICVMTDADELSSRNSCGLQNS